MKTPQFFSIFVLIMMQCQPAEKPVSSVAVWNTHEISLTATHAPENPYTEIDVWATFVHEGGDSLIRPAFWDGGNTWKIRFAPTHAGTWKWKAYASMENADFDHAAGEIQAVSGDSPNRFEHGLLTMSPGARNVVYADGTPFMLVGDTPWAIPFRATVDQVKHYAKDRQQKGYNAALLMSLQPDRYAEGPEERDTVLGFARAFADLPDGHLNNLQPAYFQYLDSLTDVLHQHGIVPVFQPVFHGFGWKGKTVLGPTADPGEYARYCRYLVARYGSKPALWLVGADADGLAPGVAAGGHEIERWDAYRQPTGIHYNPCDNWLAPWAQADSSGCFHYNRSHQAEAWLDFQWAQSGHGGKHLHYKVREMYDNKPVKAVANGEPTYEGMDNGKNGLGWWQGQNAWMELMHGGTMGVVYGAAALWQWKVTTDEPGWDGWTDQPLSWREAMEMEGSRYPGYVSKAFEGFDFADMERRWDLTTENKPLLANPGKFYISYLENGGNITIRDIPDNLPFFWFDPKEGVFKEEGRTDTSGTFKAPDNNPWVLVVGKKRS